jgi:hypothetical protein
MLPAVACSFAILQVKKKGESANWQTPLFFGQQITD